jgi:hypothetical protein
MSDKPTVKVRIAVAMKNDTYWVAEGCSTWKSDRDALRSVRRLAGDNCTTYIVTAELPIPAPTEVEGTVET